MVSKSSIEKKEFVAEDSDGEDECKVLQMRVQRVVL